MLPQTLTPEEAARLLEIEQQTASVAGALPDDIVAAASELGQLANADGRYTWDLGGDWAGSERAQELIAVIRGGGYEAQVAPARRAERRTRGSPAGRGSTRGDPARSPCEAILTGSDPLEPIRFAVRVT